MLSNSFKWKHFVGEIILLNVRWYLKDPFWKAEQVSGFKKDTIYTISSGT